ncbi:unnamed protein product [Polarella glacialis]|uniref:Uncharacterized protein n=1 Tax=Polarella glacialis TaxID=89957 RepID=A0A813H2Z5_POLGL|nr:unnamed protein product [Polarella glacialis]
MDAEVHEEADLQPPCLSIYQQPSLPYSNRQDYFPSSKEALSQVKLNCELEEMFQEAAATVGQKDEEGSETEETECIWVEHDPNTPQQVYEASSGHLPGWKPKVRATPSPAVMSAVVSLRRNTKIKDL